VINFKSYLIESNFNSALAAVEKLLKKNNRTYTNYNNTLTVELPNDTKKLSSDDDKLIKESIKVADGKMLLVKSSVGYSSGNSLLFRFPYKKARVGKAYHITSKANVEDILKNGLKPKTAKEHSKSFGTTLGDSNNIQAYTAAFVIGGKGGIKVVKGMFNFKDPVLLEIDGKGLDFWEDPLMPDNAKSRLTFDVITPDRIKEG